MSKKTHNLSATSVGTESDRHICLITPGNLSSTPRLVREAQRLLAAGYQVSVIAGSRFTPLESADRKLAAQYGFALHRPNCRSVGWVMLRILSRITRALTEWQIPLPNSFRILALDPMMLQLTKLARAIPAELYHGHCLGGLYVAINTAQHYGKAAGFDIEDYHPDEQCWQENEQWKPQVIHKIMEEYLPLCAFLTSASPGIQDACSDRYGVKSEVILNTYPRTEFPKEPTGIHSPSQESPARLYWFSQTIGPGRGLEKALTVISHMQTPCQLHLRGYPQTGFIEELQALAMDLGIDPARLICHQPAAADHMVELCSGHHLGLNLEETTPRNRNLCLTNKIFAYLAAGTPVWLSTTQAHQRIYEELGSAACLTDLNNPRAAATQLDTLLSNEDLYSSARTTASKLGKEKFCWEHDSELFLKLIQTHLHPNEYP
ncbi:MAG: hypothetical protein AAF571_01285 [Verrucomicrobiota bacterium]